MCFVASCHPCLGLIDAGPVVILSKFKMAAAAAAFGFPSVSGVFPIGWASVGWLATVVVKLKQQRLRLSGSNCQTRESGVASKKSCIVKKKKIEIVYCKKNNNK